MNISPAAGKPAETSMLANIPKLIATSYTEGPAPSAPAQPVAFGTSGQNFRGTAYPHSLPDETRTLVNHTLAAAPPQPEMPSASKLKEKP